MWSSPSPLLWGLLAATCASPVPPTIAPTEPGAHVELEPSPPPRYALVADDAPVEEVLLGWDGTWEHLEFYVALAQAITTEVPVRLVGEAQYTDPFAQYLIEAGVSPERVRRLEARIDTMWIRDYAPLFVRGVGDLVLVDLPYHPDRPLDDRFAVDLAVAQRRLRLPLDLPMEGAHLLADGAGRCVVSESVVVEAQLVDIDEGALRSRLAEVFGCDVVVFVPPLWAEETGHVDTFALVTGPAQVLVGAYPPDGDALNADLLDEGALRLEEAGFRVTRIPMPSNSRRRIFRTYTNVLLLDGAVIVPVYEGSRRWENEALDLLAEAFPTRRVIPVESEDVMELGGAIHCATRTVPRL